METILIISALLFSIILIGAAFSIFYVEQANLPTLKKKDLLGGKDSAKVLFIYPHPDDESVWSGALIAALAGDKRFDVKVVSTSSGEHGDEIVKESPQVLAEIRRREFMKAMKKLGVKNAEVWDFTDGAHKHNYAGLEDCVRQELKSGYDLIVTYEKNGLYGHPDHVILAEIIEKLRSDFPETRVLRSTTTKRKYERYNLPTVVNGEFCSTDPIAPPAYKFAALRYNHKKRAAINAHKSQNLRGFGKKRSMITSLYEYYTSDY